MTSHAASLFCGRLEHHQVRAADERVALAAARCGRHGRDAHVLARRGHPVLVVVARGRGVGPRAAHPDGDAPALELVLDLRAVALELVLVVEALLEQVGEELDALLRLGRGDRGLRAVLGELGAAGVPDERHHVVDEVVGLLAGRAERLDRLAVDLGHLVLDRLQRGGHRVPVGERALLRDARALQDVLAVVDGAGLGEPRHGPRAVLAGDLRRRPDALRVRGGAADVLDAARQVLEALERGEERDLRRAGLRDVRALARDGRVADPVLHDVPADDLGVDRDARSSPRTGPAACRCRSWDPGRSA